MLLMPIRFVRQAASTIENPTEVEGADSICRRP